MAAKEPPPPLHRLVLREKQENANDDDYGGR